MNDVRIVIPAHNEQARITPTIEDYCGYFGARATVVVVANGCSDDTVGVVRALAQRFANLRVIDIPGRVGKGGAIRAGLKTGHEAYVGFVDADHSTSAREFDRLLQRCKRERVAAVIGSRWMRGSRVEPRQPWKRQIASRVFNALVRLLLGLPFSDTQCGAKVFTRDAIRDAVAGLTLADFAFDIDLLFGVRRNGGRILEVPTVWADHAAGTTVHLASASVRMLLSLLRVRLEHSFVARLPFLEFLAAGAIIPMYHTPSVLVLADAEDSVRARALERSLGELGAAVSIERPPVVSRRSGLARLFARLRTLAWYTVGTHRRYDAVVEVASRVPFMIPSFSMKRTFLVCDGTPGGPFARLGYALYRRSRRITARHDGDQTDLARWLRLATLRVAAFEEVEGNWVIHLNRAGEERTSIELR